MRRSHKKGWHIQSGSVTHPSKIETEGGSDLIDPSSDFLKTRIPVRLRL